MREYNLLDCNVYEKSYVIYAIQPLQRALRHCSKERLSYIQLIERQLNSRKTDACYAGTSHEGIREGYAIGEASSGNASNHLVTRVCS